MNCTLVAMGAENISLQVISAMLKKHGHSVSLAYDQSLFNDMNYLSKPWLARLLDHKKTVLHQIIESQPKLVGFTVMTPTFQWALDLAREIKKYLDVPIIFGGPHPTLLPESVLGHKCVDMVCVGEGDFAMLDLCNSIDSGSVSTDIENIWFKQNGKIIKNISRKQIRNLDELPFPDKELFDSHVSIKNSYLAVTARGCPFACTYCHLSFEAKMAKETSGHRLRERSVESVLKELALNRDKYQFEWVDFRNNTFTANRKWVLEFCEKYPKRIGLPFKIFGHPLTIDETIALKLKQAGCFSVQLGIESYSEELRSSILKRHETNEDIHRCVEAMDKVGLPYSCDYILGLPTQAEEELIQAAVFFINRKHCYRISPFMLEYMPRAEITDLGLLHGELTKHDVRELEEGKHSHYLSTGSIGKNPEKLRSFMMFRVLFRLIPYLSPPFAEYLVSRKLYRVFRYIPMDSILFVLDVLMVLKYRDIYARAYVKNYFYWFRNRFNKKHPAYAFRGKRVENNKRHPL